MARTNMQTRAYIAEIVSIKLKIDELNARKRIVADKLGYGTWRSRHLPGVKVLIKLASGGWRVSWKDVAKVLAKRLELTDSELTMATYGHRTMTYEHPSCSVCVDKANRHNPQTKVA